MTTFYLASGGEPGIMRTIAERAGAVFVDKIQQGVFRAIGNRHHDAYIWVIDNDSLIGDIGVMKIELGAKAAGTPNPRVDYFENPHAALQRYAEPAQRPGVVVTDYNMPEYGINGFEVIERMKEMEKAK